MTDSSLVEKESQQHHHQHQQHQHHHQQQQQQQQKQQQQVATAKNWTIRPAKVEDAEQVERLLQESYSALLPADYDDELLSKALPLISRPMPILLTCGTWYVVVDNESGMFLGCGGWTPERPGGGGGGGGTNTGGNATAKAHLRHFATHPKATRKGVGRAIWEKSWKDVTDILGPNQSMEVYSTFTAQPFYASLGFVPVRTVELPISPDCHFPCVLMYRDGNKLI